MTIELQEIRTFDHPSIWASHPVLVATVQLPGSVESQLATDLNLHLGVTKSVAALQHPLDPLPSQVYQPLRTSADVAETLGMLALHLQQLAGESVDQSSAVAGKSASVYHVLVQSKHPDVATAAMRLAVRLLDHRLFNNPPKPDLETEFKSNVQSLADPYGMGMSSEFAIEAAHRQGVPVRRSTADRWMVELSTGMFRRRIHHMRSTNTSHTAQVIAKDKRLTYHVLARAGLPVPHSIEVTDGHAAIEAALTIGFPVVVKPVDGNHAKGVTLDIRNESRVSDAFQSARVVSTTRSAFVENHVPGNHYRILVVDGTVVSVLWRVPAHVTADGSSTVRELIEANNVTTGGAPRRLMPRKKIPLDEETFSTLATQGLSFDNVPADGSTVYARWVGPMDGGYNVAITEQIHPDNASVACQAARAVGLDISGIDFISPDISRSVWEGYGKIVEVNSAPAVRGHMDPYEGVGRDVGGAIIDMLLRPSQLRRVHIVAILTSSLSAAIVDELAKSLSESERTVGLVAGGKLVIDAMRYRHISGNRVRTMLANPAVEVAIVEIDPHDLMERELDFPMCDVLVVSSLSGLHTPHGDPIESVLVKAVAASGSIILNTKELSSEILTEYAGCKIVYTSQTSASTLVSTILGSASWQLPR